METRKITCIVCPLGCEITVKTDGGEIADIKGYSCKRGEAYARTEVADPRRTLTTTMRVNGGKAPVVSVKSDAPVPKGMLFECMRCINQARVKAPVRIGDVLIEKVGGTEANIVATLDVPCYNNEDETDDSRDDSEKCAALPQQQMAAV